MIETRSVLRQRESLDDRASGVGPPASSLEGDVDLAETTGSIVNNDAPYSTFDAAPRRVDDEVDNGVYEENHGFDEGDNVDRVRPPNDDSQDVAQFGSPGDDLQAFINESDLTTSNQDAIQLQRMHIHMCV